MKQCVFLAYSVGDSSVSVFFSELAQLLAKDYLVVVFSDKKRELSFSSQNVILLHWPSERPTKWKDFLFLKRQINKYRPNLMLSTFGANNMFLVTGYLKRVSHRIATHRTISSHFKSSKFNLLRKRWVFKLATEIMTNSVATKEDLIATFGVVSEKIRVTYNAVVNPNLQEVRDPNLIVYAGRLSANKGTQVLLDAFATIVKNMPKLHLKVLGGTAGEVQKYKDKAEELSINKQTTFLGNQPRAELLKQFSKARYVVVPSLSEAFGFVVIEAFSTRTPVIGSNTGGIKEIVRDGKDGFLVTPGDVEDLAKAMTILNNDLDMAIEMGESAHQRFLNTFELYKVVEELSQYLVTKINS
ncbi:MAG: glycosyltransferase family 4 protein [Flavobacteriaceae bacterium]|nr:glycosyltransferase family 4 protein [Flavobacteriaceae bacterium]